MQHHGNIKLWIQIHKLKPFLCLLASEFSLGSTLVHQEGHSSIWFLKVMITEKQLF